MKFSSLPVAVQVRLKEVSGRVSVVGGRCCEILAFTEGEMEGERDGRRDGGRERIHPLILAVPTFQWLLL